jgi:hypothetical protein
VEKISDTNEDLIRTAPPPAPRKPAGAQDGSAQEASGEGAGEASRKRRRGADDDVVGEDQGETKPLEAEAASKKARIGDEQADEGE